MSISDISQLRLLLCTDVLCHEAACMEHTAGWWIRRAREIALQQNLLSFRMAVRYRNRRQQRLGLWVRRIVKQLLLIRELHDMTEIHDHDTIRDVLDDTQIMRDEDVGHAHRFLQLTKQIQYL